MLKVHIDNELNILSYLGADLPGALVAEPMEPEDVPDSVLDSYGKARAIKFDKVSPENKFSLFQTMCFARCSDQSLAGPTAIMLSLPSHTEPNTAIKKPLLKYKWLIYEVFGGVCVLAKNRLTRVMQASAGGGG